MDLDTPTPLALWIVQPATFNMLVTRCFCQVLPWFGSLVLLYAQVLPGSHLPQFSGLWFGRLRYSAGSWFPWLLWSTGVSLFPDTCLDLCTQMLPLPLPQWVTVSGACCFWAIPRWAAWVGTLPGWVHGCRFTLTRWVGAIVSPVVSLVRYCPTFRLDSPRWVPLPIPGCLGALPASCPTFTG